MNTKIKWILPSLLMLAVALAAFAVTGCNRAQDHGSHAHQYTCPMKEHSDVVSDKPGNCPKCGMKLVEKK
jgi:hypothetical protein